MSEQKTCQKCKEYVFECKCIKSEVLKTALLMILFVIIIYATPGGHAQINRPPPVAVEYDKLECYEDQIYGTLCKAVIKDHTFCFIKSPTMNMIIRCDEWEEYRI